MVGKIFCEGLSNTLEAWLNRTLYLTVTGRDRHITHNPAYRKS
jgi:hypothetical protein